MKNQKEWERFCSATLAGILLIGSMPVYAQDSQEGLPNPKPAVQTAFGEEKKVEATQRYLVPVKLMHAHELGKASMGNGALVKTALVTVQGDMATVDFFLDGLSFMNMFGHVTKIFYYKDNYYKYNDPKAQAIEMQVVRTHMDTDLTGKPREFPKQLRFTLQRDFLEKEGFAWVKVWVDAMDSIANDGKSPYEPGKAGTGAQNAKLTFDFSNKIEVEKEAADDLYTVAFSSKYKNDQNQLAPTQMVIKGKQAVEPTEFSKGMRIQREESTEKKTYVFKGWYQGDQEFDFSTPVTGDVKLSAKWEEAASVDKTALEQSLVKAKEKLKASEDLIVAESADQVEKGTKFIVKTAKEALEKAIGETETVLRDPEASQEGINAAKDSLDQAIETFETGIQIGTRERPSEPTSEIPKFTDKSVTVEDAAFYKKDYDPKETEEEKLDKSNDFWSQEIEYEEFEDKGITVYKIGFGNQFKKSDDDYMCYTDAVSALLDGKEYKAEMTQAGPDRLFRFVLPGKVRKEVPLKIHALPSVGTDYEYKEVVLQVRDTTKPDTPPIPEDPQKIQDGVYPVKVDLKNYYENKASMGNKALTQDATVTVKGGKATINLSVKPIDFSGIFGGLTNIFVIKEGTKYNHAKKDNLIPALGSEKKTFKDKEGKEKEYFTKFTFDVPLEAVKEKREVGLVVWVDAMDSIAGGTPGAGQQPAMLRIYGGNTPMDGFPEEEPGIPNMPKTDPASPVDPLTNPKTIYGMAEHYHEAGAPSMANTTLDHNVLVEELEGKTRYQVTFNEFVDKEFGINEPMVSVGQLWYKDTNGKVKEAYLAGKDGNKRVYRFEITGGVQNRIDLTALVVPMQKILGDGAAIQKTWLNLSDKQIEGKTTDDRYERIYYETILEEDPQLTEGLVQVKTPGITGLKKVSRTYKTINGVITGKAIETKEEVIKGVQNQVLSVWNKQAYEAKKLAYEKEVNQNTQNFHPGKLVIPDREEIEFIANPFLGGYVQVQEEEAKTTYKLHFAADSVLNSMVQKISVTYNGKDVPVQNLGTQADKSTEFQFTLEGKKHAEIPMEVSYRNDLKTPCKLLVAHDKNVVFSRDILDVKKLEDIDFKVIEREDPNLEKGKTRVEQEGIKGEKYQIIYGKTVDGKILFKHGNGSNFDQWPKLEAGREEVLKAPVDKIVLKGTKESPKLVDKAALKTILEKAKTTKQADTTSKDGTDVEKDKTWVTSEVQTALDQALKTATEIAGKEQASQDEVNQAVESLKDALSQYNLQKGTKETTPSKPDIPSIPEKPGNSKKPHKPGKKSSLETSVKKEEPKRVEERKIPEQVVSKEQTKSQGFTDIEGHWAKDAINYVVEKGYFKGIGNHQFAPEAPISRGDFVTVLGRMAGIDPNQYSKNTFKDVGKTYYTPYIIWAAENGIVQGAGDGIFQPKRDISREEMATIMAKYLKVVNKNLKEKSQATFPDQGTISSWAKDAVNEMAKLGLVKGNEKGNFAPKGIFTRAQVAQVLYNVDHN